MLDGQSISSAMREELSYDKMGNIQSLQRDGATAITYHYTGNRLNSISGGLSGSYSYDAIGNALTDRSGFTYIYNHLNQPSTISKTGVSISYSYDALGNKRSSEGALGAGITQDYLPGGIEYTNGTLDRIATAEGYITFSGSTPVYQYYLRDHLGNVRTVFSASGGTATVIQQQDYYPFGLRKALAGAAVNPYLYNGKELQGELGQYDYGARFYDPVVGRWNVVDPLGEQYSMVSPYAYGMNDPIYFIDPDGMRTEGFFTRYEDENGNLIKETDDATVIIPHEKIKDFLKEFKDSERQNTQNSIMSNESWIRRYGEGMYADPGDMVQDWAVTALTGKGVQDAIPGLSENATREGGGFRVNPVGPSLIVLGSRLVPKLGGVGGGGAAGAWTSVASKSLRWTDRVVQSALGTNYKLPAKGLLHRALGTRGVGAAAGRAVPYAGWVITITDLSYELGKHYGPSKWYGKDDTKWFK